LNVYRAALSFVIHKQGVVADADIDQRLETLRVKKGVTLDPHIFRGFIQKGLDFYHKHYLTVLVCTDGPCLKHSDINPSERSMNQLTEEFGCAVQATGCHWHCSEGPTVTIKNGDDAETFIGCNSPLQWNEIKNKVQALKLSATDDTQREIREYSIT
jgi:hypothetical protein